MTPSPKPGSWRDALSLGRVLGQYAAGKISKSVLVSGMKPNRAEEREREREAGKWLLGEPDAMGSDVAGTEDRTDEIEDEQSYASPSRLDLLRRQRETRWKGDEKNDSAG